MLITHLISNKLYVSEALLFDMWAAKCLNCVYVGLRKQSLRTAGLDH